MKIKSPKTGLARICRLFGITRQAYYDKIWREKEKTLEEEIILQNIAEIRKRLPRVGGRKLWVLLEPVLLEHSIKLGRDGLFDLLSANGLLVRRRRRSGPKTTHSHHRFRKWKNKIENWEPLAPNRLWVCDITYVRLKGGAFAYLSLITDGYSRKIAGWRLHPTLEWEGSLGALKQALQSAPAAALAGLIHHSDRGVQYCCEQYVEILQKNGLEISMTETSDPRDNAIAERVNGILKNEMVGDASQMTYKQANSAIKLAIDAYNTLRPHLSLDYLTPQIAHEGEGQLKKHWKKLSP
jgi:transposase InsO family protein